MSVDTYMLKSPTTFVSACPLLENDLMILDMLTVDPSEFAARTGWDIKTERTCKGDVEKIGAENYYPSTRP